MRDATDIVHAYSSLKINMWRLTAYTVLFFVHKKSMQTYASLK